LEWRAVDVQLYVDPAGLAVIVITTFEETQPQIVVFEETGN